MLSHSLTGETALLLNEAGVVLAACGQWRLILGQGGVQLVGQCWWDYVHPREHVGMRVLWQRALAHPEVTIWGRCSLRNATGQWVTVQVALVNRLADPDVRAVVMTVEQEILDMQEEPEITQVQGRTYDLALALRHQQFVLHYQPVVAVATGLLVGFEALVRWQHPSWGLLGPGEFIPLAEANGLMVPLGRWVLEQAVAQLAQWQARWDLPAGFRMHVNVAPVQLTDPEFVPTVAQALQANGSRPEQLVLEITEGVLVGDMAATQATLLRLRELGVWVALDDFGTGYSSLARLHDLPIQYLKIDRSFLRGMGLRAQTIVTAMVQLGTSLGLTVVAEGVESEMQWRWLQRLGCPLAQGYWFSRPLPCEGVPTFLTQTLGAC
ncbi:EAL domain-containing protein [Gloeomargarita sp.]